MVVVCRQRNHPSVLRFERGRGGGGGVETTPSYPLRLAFRAREGGDGVSTEKLPPPSRVSSEGGGGDGGSGVSTEETPLRLTFRVRKGW